MLGIGVPSRGTWWEVSARLAGPAQAIRHVRPVELNAAPRMVSMTTHAVTTRHAPAHAGCSLRSTVTHTLDQQMEVAPSTALSKGGRGHWLSGPCERGPVGRPRTLKRKTGGDVHQATRARTYTHSTPPWGQLGMRTSWLFDGAFVLSGHPNQPSEEEAGMT
jgi:hypothetical protein